MDENRPNNNNTTTTFSIPRASFTAFRLTYASSESISHYAKVLLLGRLPDIWSKDSGPGFLSATSHFAKNTVRSKFRSATKTISSSIRSASNLKNEGAAPSIRSSIKSSRRIRLSAPEPVGLVADDFVLAEREHSRFVRKLRHFATTSKGRAKKSSNDLRSRIYNAVLQKYSVGEVLRIEKMLIMTKILTSNATRFTEDDPCSNRTYENWKEHYVVLRKTDNKIEPLALQFYDIHSVTHDTKSVPEVNFRLSKDVNAQFYSELDKSISISVPQKGEIFGYILKCHDQLSAFRWLHFIKQALGDVMEPYFRVFLPELNVSIRIKVPESILAKSLEPSSNMEISQLEHGYSVEYSPLITYIKECIRTILDNQSNEVLEFLNHTNWFCFRRYDRLEWALNNSEIFFIQNQLLSGQHFLEFRRIGNSSVVSSSATGTIHEEPIPIEGFLSRLSNTSGKSKSLLRTFYKVSYFYTCDSILFFTKYYRAIPPTRDPKSSAGLEDDQSEIYEHSPYPVNKDGHISWLNKDSFHHHDELALSELERRAQQVVKAEAIIDLCLVKEIRAVPHTQLTKTQKVLLCYFWYSDTSLADDKNIIESAFEIEMMNGSVVKLQAPNRFIRDQWVSKLSAIAQYWSLRQQSDLRRLLLVRNSNQNVLNIPEFVDSNFNFELNNLEYQHSVADPRIHSIESVAMKKCILMSGYLYQKSKKHANFNKFFVILCPGFIILYSLFKRSKATGVWKDNSLFEHYLTIPISTCYIYSGTSTELDLLNRQKDVDPRSPGRHSLPRLYADGWKSSDEEAMRCFTLWFGRKRKITGREKAISSYDSSFKTDVSLRNSTQKNPGLTKLIGKLGFTGKSIVFMTRSRQEREIWTGKILCEIDRFAKSH
ncbi:Pleckstrin homology domain-containing protein [Scheffersomyces xylosifermentans]|uniref:Pleckstrin homology domain-containing protein n=1 Tax=Scheffersomyces xylosifermentans TaxID=1304137 RepID=UPI00315D25C5